MIRRRNAHEGDSPTVMWWVRDWLTSEAVLSMPRAARSLYFDLLLHQWINGSLPAETKVLASLTGEGHTAFLKLWQHCSACFEKGDDGRLRNQRMEAERKADEDYRLAKSNAGKDGAAKRWQKHGTPMQSATDLPIPNGCPSSSSSSSHSSPSENPPTPRKRGKRAGRARWVPPDLDLGGHPSLDTPTLRAAWARWETYRAEMGKRLTPTGRRDTLNAYADRGPAALIAAIENTIVKGIQGLQDPYTPPGVTNQVTLEDQLARYPRL